MNHYTAYSKKTASISFMGQGFMIKWNSYEKISVKTCTRLSLWCDSPARLWFAEWGEYRTASLCIPVSQSIQMTQHEKESVESEPAM